MSVAKSATNDDKRMIQDYLNQRMNEAWDMYDVEVERQYQRSLRAQGEQSAQKEEGK